MPAAGYTKKRKREAPRGRVVDPVALDEVRALVGNGPFRHDLLIEYLHRINDRYKQLGAAHLAALARLMGLAQTQVYEVATFYHHFDVVKEDRDGKIPAPAALTVRVCDGLSCEMAGARSLLERLPALLGRDVRVIAAPCIGRCEQAPVAVIHQKPVPSATPEAVQGEVQAGNLYDAPANYVDFEAYLREGGYSVLRDCAEHRRDLESVLKTMEDSGLRGLGGAGFPTGRKWRIVRGEAAPRLMAVNIDEGEPGTFKDRAYLERDPHRFLEGMLIAAWAVRVSAIYIYLRDEYHGCRALLEAELAKLRANPPAPLPKIELRRGAGAYICGEESAMIESIEGKRGLPRHRPPYVAQVGLFGRPTLEQNVETLFWVRDIVDKGPEWVTSQGRHERKGFRSFSVSGRVKEPGVKVAPAGVTVRELIDEFCGGMAAGHSFKGYLPGGASGGILPASMADLPLDFGTLEKYGCFVGSHAVVILSDKDDMKAVALNLMKFFEDESCGQCTPCRVGTEKAAELMATGPWDPALLDELSAVMRDASICGLGQAAPNPLLSVLKYFPDELIKPLGHW
jgi:formate dehydrogenase